MEIKGRIIQAFPETSGTSKAGNPWKKRTYVLETIEQFPRKVFFEFFGDKADQYPLAGGDTVTLSFDIESHEYQGRWYTSIRGWKAEKEQPAQPQTAPQQMPGDFPPPPVYPPVDPAGPKDDLPF